MIFNITSLAMTDDTFPILYGIVQTADVSSFFSSKVGRSGFSSLR